MSSSPYAAAAKLLNQILTKKKGLKTLAYNSKGELTCTKATYAQCSHVLEHKPILDRLRKSIPDVQAKNIGLMYVLLYELLLGPNLSIRGGGALKRQLVAHHNSLKKTLSSIQKKALLGPNTRTTRTVIPRYVRVNTIKTTSRKAIQAIKKKTSSIYVDAHVPDVLVLSPTPASRELLQDLVTSHEVILQDKSSCFSALCLVHGFETKLPARCAYIDACAAPGNKTSHLASLVPPESIIHAFDKSTDRFKLLQRRMTELVGPKVKCYPSDFLTTSSKSHDGEPSKVFADVQAILLDPSCSGSGMTGNHQEANRDPSFCNDRIQSVSDFQLKALQHATSAFPKVQRVVYSTCSLYMQENESVVQRFMETASDEWKLVPPKCLQTWKRRGMSYPGLTKQQSESLIRVHPDEDATNGFFVACFERRNLPSKQNTSSEWEGVHSSGLDVYNNQFNQLDSSKNDSAETTLESEDTQSKKRKAPETTISKKRAKKAEWKRKQRQRKLERLEKKQKIRDS